MPAAFGIQQVFALLEERHAELLLEVARGRTALRARPKGVDRQQLERDVLTAGARALELERLREAILQVLEGPAECTTTKTS